MIKNELLLKLLVRRKTEELGKLVEELKVKPETKTILTGHRCSDRCMAPMVIVSKKNISVLFSDLAQFNFQRHTFSDEDMLFLLSMMVHKKDATTADLCPDVDADELVQVMKAGGMI